MLDAFLLLYLWAPCALNNWVVVDGSKETDKTRKEKLIAYC